MKTNHPNCKGCNKYHFDANSPEGAPITSPALKAAMLQLLGKIKKERKNIMFPL